MVLNRLTVLHRRTTQGRKKLEVDDLIARGRRRRLMQDRNHLSHKDPAPSPMVGADEASYLTGPDANRQVRAHLAPQD